MADEAGDVHHPYDGGKNREKGESCWNPAFPTQFPLAESKHCLCIPSVLGHSCLSSGPAASQGRKRCTWLCFPLLIPSLPAQHIAAPSSASTKMRRCKQQPCTSGDAAPAAEMGQHLLKCVAVFCGNGWASRTSLFHSLK